MRNFQAEFVSGEKFMEVCPAVVTSKEIPDGVMTERYVFCKTDYLKSLFSMLQHRKSPVILITHNSDYPIDAKRWAMKPSCIEYWYAANVEVNRPGLIPIPLGLENVNSPGYSHNYNSIAELIVMDLHKTDLVFMNFNRRTNEKVRNPVVDKFKDQEWVNYHTYGISFNKCMREIARAKFVFCPRGNGLDTHRFWESVYLGAIPIVEKCYMYESFTHIRKLMVNSFSEVTKEMLEKKWKWAQKIKSSKLEAKMSHWKQRLGR